MLLIYQVIVKIKKENMVENLSVHLQAVHVIPPAWVAQAAVVVVPAGTQQHSRLHFHLLIHRSGYLNGPMWTVSLQKQHRDT